MNAEPAALHASLRSRSQRVGAAAVLASILVISGCAAGQQAQTAYQKPTVDGTNADIGTIALRGLAVQAPSGPFYETGSDATIKLVLVNSGSKADRLMSIKTPVAGDWAAYTSSADAQAVIGADTSGASSSGLSSSGPSQSSTVATSKATSKPAARPGAKKSGPAAPSSTTSSQTTPSQTTPSQTTSSQTTPAPLPSAAIPTINPGGRTSWGVPEAQGALVLRHLTARIYAGTVVPITFTFENAGTITVDVPVALAPATSASIIPAPTSSAVAP